MFELNAEASTHLGVEPDQALVLDTSADDVLEQTLAWLDADRAPAPSNCG